MNGTGSLTIPLLPCVSWDDTLEFWQMLGFEVALKQRSPNAYAVIRRDDYELHLFGLKQLKPEENFSTCLVIVPEVEALHHTFAEGLRTALGKVPMKDWPQITRMKLRQSRFTVTDNAGNSVIFTKRGDEDNEAAKAYKKADQTPLQRAVSLATRLRDFKGDDAQAARFLDKALSANEHEPALNRARARAARIELAIALDDFVRAQALHTEFKQLALSDEDRQLLGPELAAMEVLERTLTK